MNPDLQASIHRRLLNLARAEGRPFVEILQYYALNRFLYRLGRSSYRSRFILKGALLLTVWRLPNRRSTRDIDLLGQMENDPLAIATVIQAVCQEPAPEDGLVYHAESVTCARIIEGASYSGVRVRFLANLGPARINMQIDIGFGDALVPGPIPVTLPALLELPPAEVLGYSPESTIAEKLQIMVALGEINSRLKDYYDTWLLALQRSFEGIRLAEAIQATFIQRATKLSWPLIALGEYFADENRGVQWRAFLRRQHLAETITLREVIVAITDFVKPVVSALLVSNVFPLRWSPGGPWR